MRAFPAALERLTEQFARLPGIGMKSAQRLAFYVLSLPKEDADSFAQAIVDAKNSVRLCPVCQNLTDQELCGICKMVGNGVHHCFIHTDHFHTVPAAHK